jgi:hypothetical protein
MHRRHDPIPGGWTSMLLQMLGTTISRSISTTNGKEWEPDEHSTPKKQLPPLASSSFKAAVRRDACLRGKGDPKLEGPQSLENAA